ncbi:hypothetical protein BC827DRAFT_1235426 [Russula dissimulans]|nr:hypothetical protein BC827DRAFT_1235426 [Russula dissimulans]
MQPPKMSFELLSPPLPQCPCSHSHKFLIWQGLAKRIDHNSQFDNSHHNSQKFMVLTMGYGQKISRILLWVMRY